MKPVKPVDMFHTTAKPALQQQMVDSIPIMKGAPAATKQQEPRDDDTATTVPSHHSYSDHEDHEEVSLDQTISTSHSEDFLTASLSFKDVPEEGIIVTPRHPNELLTVKHSNETSKTDVEKMPAATDELLPEVHLAPREEPQTPRAGDAPEHPFDFDAIDLDRKPAASQSHSRCLTPSPNSGRASKAHSFTWADFQTPPATKHSFLECPPTPRCQRHIIRTLPIVSFQQLCLPDI
jgi:hypothetical protein